jgi:hypothetical protein
MTTGRINQVASLSEKVRDELESRFGGCPHPARGEADPGATPGPPFEGH